MLATHVCVQYTMCTLGAPIGVQFPLWTCFPGGIGRGAYMEKIMGEAVARVARKVNETVENGADSLDLADCKLMMFPIGIYKVMRNVTEGIHLITLANNELKSVTSKFITTFSQMRGVQGSGKAPFSNQFAHKARSTRRFCQRGSWSFLCAGSVVCLNDTGGPLAPVWIVNGLKACARERPGWITFFQTCLNLVAI
ncbi:leucine-rich repeat-containing protein 20 isoform X3 [Gopherus flavomarginatus]|uniref:leucine-rich repeat-containing protein 20 isoform X3 n=1 Tax=Gopherus flavomarginatus TaxID=286002 RepID=UPI0021CC173E|nr:leucine-rich repeat-containing protein 20 isoform X3 [Gopherus flavomarginatus]